MLRTFGIVLVSGLFAASCGTRNAGRDLKSPVGAENTSDACADTLDNDADGYVDQDDPDCLPFYSAGPETNCDDTLDNDADGKTDCDDGDCATSPACAAAEDTNAECTDGTDCFYGNDCFTNFGVCYYSMCGGGASRTVRPASARVRRNSR